MSQINQYLDVLTYQKILALAPMAGITDNPFRQIAQQFGADWTVGEMLSSDPSLQQTRQSLQRRNHDGESGAVVVQIAGSDPNQLAQAAQLNHEYGAQVIDINMGCPAKKVCHVMAGSALLQNEPLVEQILNTVVQAVSIPVTLKTRLGWNAENKNILTIAKMAEQAGIAALSIHGRTREQMYHGDAEYDLIADVKQSVTIPVWVNGDITSPQKAAQVLQQTGADGVMIGRGAQGQPWLFADVRYYLQTGQLPEPISFQAACQVILAHLAAMHAFYGEVGGVRMARKHIGWYLARLPDGRDFCKQFNQINYAVEQSDKLAAFLHRHSAEYEFWWRDY